MIGKTAMIIVFVGPLAVLGIAMIRLVTDPYVHRFPYQKPKDRDIVPFDRNEAISRMQKERNQ